MAKGRAPLALILATVVAACAPSATASRGPGPTGTPTASTSSGVTPLPSFVPSPTPALPTGPGRIVFAEAQGAPDDYKLYLVNPDGSGLKLLLAGTHAIPRWSPDGRQLAITTTSFGQRQFETILNADGSLVRYLSKPDPSLTLVCTLWSPDGDSLVCEGWAPSKAGREGLYQLSAVNASGLTRLTTSTGGIHDVPGAYSPDGTKIVFVRATYVPTRLGQLWVDDLVTKTVTKVTDTLVGYRVSWSPDGRWIAGDANGSLLLFDATNFALPPRQITIPKGAASQPRFSPDGTRLVFSWIPKGSTNAAIFTVNLDGTDPQRLTSGARSDLYPDWGITP